MNRFLPAFVLAAWIALGQETPAPKDEEARKLLDDWTFAALVLESSHVEKGEPCQYASFLLRSCEKKLGRLLETKEAFQAKLASLEDEKKAAESRRIRLMVQGKMLSPDEEEEIDALGDQATHLGAVLKRLAQLRDTLVK